MPAEQIVQIKIGVPYARQMVEALRIVQPVATIGDPMATRFSDLADEIEVLLPPLPDPDMEAISQIVTRRAPEPFTYDDILAAYRLGKKDGRK